MPLSLTPRWKPLALRIPCAPRGTPLYDPVIVQDLGLFVASGPLGIVICAISKPQGWIAGIDFTNPAAAIARVAAEFDGWAPELTALIKDAETAIPRTINALPIEHRYTFIASADDNAGWTMLASRSGRAVRQLTTSRFPRRTAVTPCRRGSRGTRSLAVSVLRAP